VHTCSARACYPDRRRPYLIDEAAIPDQRRPYLIGAGQDNHQFGAPRKARFMAQFPKQPTASLWSGLQWTRSDLVKTKTKNQPLAAKEAPSTPGLYRMTWIGTEGWDSVRKTMCVKSTLKVADRTLEFEELRPPVLLTIGKSTDIRERIGQHFGTNPNNNRVISGLGHLLLPKPVYEDLIEIVRCNIRVEWVEVASWVDRCLLEKYGCSVERPILDLEAEH
jgi:hypothetical protein